MTKVDPHQQVVEHASRGDAIALDVLLERHLASLETFVRLHAHDVVHMRESCADICQSVCREVLENMGKFEYRGEAQFRHWLFLTAKSKLVERIRFWRAGKRDVAKERPLAPRQDRSEFDQSRFHDMLAQLPSPSQHAMGREQMQRFEAAFQRLSPEQQELITLSRIVGFSHAEIAQRSGTTETAVRQAVHRALVRLARHVDDTSESKA
ncbi:MAG TPA: sigma-70 family RNA polymerase sigma factor [Planctomycetota bacterium]